ncbi:putative hydrolase of the HAD superfamily [Allofrancisella inopinata]|uniref:Pyrimidine 5'-nucleotidase n=1 Tax=Allofrancisella inopinata TaxID=1085647 RepID=A0AAE6YHK3_9GAMM|nr:pyrimidine 5'-nucleotidase [Allofrancisella inopinata]QIV95873.1 pyrimidine 5'-nucleotidase [Allofrancisella inopinata]TDT72913.1 putative hydrolase of the HAD superfamily [Allofrancisella inopinata]
MKTYIFDLDNTLYSYKNGLFDSQLERMREYIKIKLKISDDEKADAIRDELYYECGSTMLGLMRYHNIDYKEYLNFIDDIDIGHFQPNLKLNSHLRTLKNTSNVYVFTNASNFHADRVMKQFGLDNLFHGVLTLEDTELVAKPKEKYFEVGKNKFGIDFSKAIFFEDSSHNLVTAKYLGMETVLIHADDKKSAVNFYESQEIDYYVKDVESFLEGDYIATRN